jgi:hypothetical protein
MLTSSQQFFAFKKTGTFTVSAIFRAPIFYRYYAAVIEAPIKKYLMSLFD